MIILWFNISFKYFDTFHCFWLTKLRKDEDSLIFFDKFFTFWDWFQLRFDFSIYCQNTKKNLCIWKVILSIEGFLFWIEFQVFLSMICNFLVLQRIVFACLCVLWLHCKYVVWFAIFATLTHISFYFLRSVNVQRCNETKEIQYSSISSHYVNKGSRQKNCVFWDIGLIRETTYPTSLIRT